MFCKIEYVIKHVPSSTTMQNNGYSVNTREQIKYHNKDVKSQLMLTTTEER